MVITSSLQSVTVLQSLQSHTAYTAVTIQVTAQSWLQSLDIDFKNGVTASTAFSSYLLTDLSTLYRV